MEVKTEEIANRVVVFRAVQTPKRDFARIGHGAIAVESVLQGLGQCRLASGQIYKVVNE